MSAETESGDRAAAISGNIGAADGTEAKGSGAAPIQGWAEMLRPAAILALVWVGFQTYSAFDPFVDTLVQRSMHIAFALSMALLITSRDGSPAWRWANYALALAALLPPLILWNELPRIADRFLNVDPLEPIDFLAGGILLALLIECARRMLGPGLTLVVVLFIAYQFVGQWMPGLLAHDAGDIHVFFETQIFTIDGLLGVPTGVSVDTVFYFILFAAVFECFGGGRMIIDLALSMTGAATGGPAKSAVVSSAMIGSVSGSAVANVMSTGIFTIPLMIRVKYSPRFAGAVEAVASTGGQVMPPVMGAAAFIMADFLQIPYSQVAIAAILPSLLYFACVLLCVDLEARKRRLPKIDREEVPRVRDTLRERGLLLLPLAWLAYRIVTGHSVTYSSIEAIVLTLVLGMASSRTRGQPLDIARALVQTAERAVNVALPCAVAGVIVSVVAYTGLGAKFTSLVVQWSGGEMVFILGLAMVATIILGAGMPTASAYIMGAILIAPALVQLGIDPIVAHFFVFYFAIMSMLTPPIALSAYAAATISGASSSSTGWQAFVLAIPGFVIPFGMVLHPGLLLIGDWTDSVIGVTSALFGLLTFGAAIIGWLFRPLSAPMRAGFVALGLASFVPDPTASLVVAGAIALTVVALWWTRERERAMPA